MDTNQKRKILLLHGNQQTGDVLLGRINKLKKSLWQQLRLDIVAPDAPHLYSEQDNTDCVDRFDGDEPDNSDLWKRTWWHQGENSYRGIEDSLSMLDKLWNNTDSQEFIAIVGFSQGSRLAHIISIIHTITNGRAFPGLECVIHFSGYGDCSMPDNLTLFVNDHWGTSSALLDNIHIKLPSLHVMGESDALIPLKSSEALLKWYDNPSVYIHPGNHFMPVKRLDVERYISFLNKAIGERITTNQQLTDTVLYPSKTNNSLSTDPDDEHAQTQIDEVAALAQIFPSEFCLLSASTPTNPDHYDPDDYFGENRSYEHPIRYSILLQPQEDFSMGQVKESVWPPRKLSLCIQYPKEYPDVVPQVSLIHDMNYFEFSMEMSNAVMDVVRNAMIEESGSPCGLGMINAARSFFEEGGLASCKRMLPIIGDVISDNTNAATEQTDINQHSHLKPSNPTRIKQCNAQGLKIALTLLNRDNEGIDSSESNVTMGTAAGKGGIWRYTVGLIGKPSAGKSTFFNAATAFARQRGEGESFKTNEADGDAENGTILGGASMAPHPFTTIDPNIGYCLIPAPPGKCPEDEVNALTEIDRCSLTLGSSHGRDLDGRRLVPACLKDVAGLVPGAYQGRGRGNKFLDDLTDADVLIHIVDASGSSDAEGNNICGEGMNDELIDPIDDLEWVRNELVEWVYSNVSSKWDGIIRKGKKKLLDMFSGYKQNQSFTLGVFKAVEEFVKANDGRERIFEHLDTWDDGDLHRLVSAFLGARFPMALALNKSDIPSALLHINDVNSKLPIHGAHIGVGMSAYEEMVFVRQQVSHTLKKAPPSQPMSLRVWDCLQAAMTLREPVFVFPVNDWKTYEPLPGMSKYVTRDCSLPNNAHVRCITAAGGSAPSQWSDERCTYFAEWKENGNHALRDVLLFKPGSTVEHVFLGLKGMGAIDGDFVRAEAACMIGDKPKPVMKSEIVQKHNRILRIMTTKRKAWQKL